MLKRLVKKSLVSCGTAFVVLGTACPVLADTPCAVDPARSQIALTLSANALAIRNKLFLMLCPDGQQPLVDISDPTLAGRLERPKLVAALAPEGGPFHQPGSVLLTYVVELDGSVKHATVLASSGFKELDLAAVEVWSHAKFAGPGKLDGQPVRVLSYAKVPFKIN